MPKKLLLLIVVALLVISSLFLTSKIIIKMTGRSKSPMEKQIANFDLRPQKAYLSGEKKDYYILQKHVMSNCEETQAVSYETSLSPPYIEQLKEDIKAELNIDNSLGLLFINETVPNTNTCLIVWLVDRTGKGFAGFRNRQGELIILATTYPKEKMEGIFHSQDCNRGDISLCREE